MKYFVKKIIEPDYGCEERPTDYVRMDSVILRITDGSEKSIQVADAELYEKDINEGDWEFFDVDDAIHKEKTFEEWLEQEDHIISDGDSINIDGRSSGIVDPDKSVLAFEYYIRLLNVKNCKNITFVYSPNNKYKDTVARNELSDGAKKYIVEYVDYNTFWERHSSLERIKHRGYRVGLGFVYNGKWHLLEVDTLLGGKSVNRLYGEMCTEEDVLHSIGNLGLVPVGSGVRSRIDFIGTKIRDTDATRMGFSKKELGKLMLYGDGNEGVYGIGKNSTKQEVYECIKIREQMICELLKSR